MVQKCKNCGTPIVRWPIKKQPDKSLIENFNEGTINWINAIKMDIVSIIFFLAILTMVFTYNIDMGNCKEIVEDPCDYCSKTNCCQYLEEQRTPPYLDDSGFIIKSAGGELDWG